MKTSWRSASLTASAVAVLTLTTACGQESGTSNSSQNVGATAPGSIAGVGAGSGVGSGVGAGVTESPGEAGTDGAGELAVSANAELGKILTDGNGKTLYRFDSDTAEPPKSNCDGDCATAWPPVTADDVTAGDGIDKSLLGEVTRSDGTKQLTVAGWPAYYYAKDASAGDTSGQGVGNKWFALTADGKKAKSGSGSGSSDTDQPGLSVRNDPNLGEIVVDKNGMTVYRFLKDKAWPDPISNCEGACVEKWPVVAPVATNDTKGVQKKGGCDGLRTRADSAHARVGGAAPAISTQGGLN